MPIELSAEGLPEIAARASVPHYRRGSLSAGIVHFGVGNFHRAHQAVYLDSLFNLGFDHDWGLIGAGVRANDTDMRKKLLGQDYLTTVVEQEADENSARVTASMIDFLPVGDLAAISETLADPKIRIVSLTVTEGGYYIDPASQRFDVDHPDIVADSANPEAPKTVFGLILLGLQLRRERGVIPFTVMSCDNIPGNGHVAQNAVAGLADLINPELAAVTPRRPSGPRRNGMTASGPASPIRPMPLANGKTVGRSTTLFEYPLIPDMKMLPLAERRKDCTPLNVAPNPISLPREPTPPNSELFTAPKIMSQIPSAAMLSALSAIVCRALEAAVAKAPHNEVPFISSDLKSEKKLPSVDLPNS